MTQENYSAVIISFFLADPDVYSETTLALLKGLQAQFSTKEFKDTVQEVLDHFGGTELGQEFFRLLLENNFNECLGGTTRLDPSKAADYLEHIGIKDYPKQVGEHPDYGQDFWQWFEESLPKATQQQVWKAMGENPYG